MRSGIPEHKIDEIRDATDIVELVSGYVTLKQKGQNHFGLCPFHNEKTPSFSVHAEKQIFHCFGCGAGGNAFTFLMRYEGTGFPDVVKFLAQRAGIELEFEQEEQDPDSARENEALFHINEFAAEWFQESLFADSGKPAMDYLKNRGLNVDQIKSFGLGYAPPGWDNLMKRASETANSEDALLLAGLILQNDAGRRYDRFRDRIMFPVWNLSGRVVAFGGRILEEVENAPKYLNSPETAVYHKGDVLYGLFQNRDAIRHERKVIFVEGYMDVLSLVARGVANVVATSGTALTEGQARLVRRYTRNVVLMYDSDLAGLAATLRGADVLIENGLDVSVAELPAGHDPDSLIREQGKDAIVQVANQAGSIFEHRLNQILETEPKNRTHGIRALLESLTRVKDMIQRSVLMTRAANQLGIEEKVLWAELEDLSRKRQHQFARRSEIGDRLRDVGKGSKPDRSGKAVDDLVRILLHDWSLAEFVFNHLDLSLVGESDKLSVLTYMRNQHTGGGSPSEADFLHQFHDVGLAQFVVGELHTEWEDGMDLHKWAADCINALQRDRIQRQIDILREELKGAADDPARVREIVKELGELERLKQAHISC